MRKKKIALYLGKYYGTDLYIHWTFLLIVFAVFVSAYKEESDWRQALLSIGFLISVFACITLHEFGHILVARRFGYPARNITLYPIGGIASLEKIPEKPYQEFWMALAGPWVNIVIAAVIFLAISWSHGMPEFGYLEALTPGTFLYNLMVVNISLAMFNLIPAFPTDGGRILRALLSWKMDRVQATRIAARIGQGLASVAIIAGLFFNWWLMVIGLVILFGAGGEAIMEVTRAAMAKHRVKDALMRRYTLLRAGDTLETAMTVMLDSHEKQFIIDLGQNQYGSITAAEVVNGLKSAPKKTELTRFVRSGIPSLDINTSLDDAFHTMMAKDLEICPVTENDQLIGILDLNNINEFVAFELAQGQYLTATRQKVA